MSWTELKWHAADQAVGKTSGGIPFRVSVSPPFPSNPCFDPVGIRLRLEHAHLRLLRGFDDLLCLEGLNGVEHLPHQIETVRKVLRHFRSRALLADEVGLGKTIEACLLIREYLLRGLARRILILVPAPLVSQWDEELHTKFGLEFSVAGKGANHAGAEFWIRNDRVLSSISLAKTRAHFDNVTAAHWDLVVVDEAHHCKNRTTRNWQLVNALKRRALFLLTATPVQNNLLELYNLLTLLEPGHLKTESDFKKTYVTRGNPRDPRNQEKLRVLLREVMIRNTRSLVHLDLPPRFAQTMVVHPDTVERDLYNNLDEFLRAIRSADQTVKRHEEEGEQGNGEDGDMELPLLMALSHRMPKSPANYRSLNRRQLSYLLSAAGSHPAALAPMLERIAEDDPMAQSLLQNCSRIDVSAKERKLIELLEKNSTDKTLVFANYQATLQRLQAALSRVGIAFSVFSGEQSASEKDRAVEEFRQRVPVMLCSESGGEGRNLQFANTLINFDLPWNPMRIEQRVGRIHRIGQAREVFVFNLCTAGSLEERILRLLDTKIRMFELVVGEVGSILGNLEGGEEFETLVLDLWMRSHSKGDLDSAFEQLGDALLNAQEEYLKTKELDDALFGDDYE